jgi:hypothetical protein
MDPSRRAFLTLAGGTVGCGLVAANTRGIPAADVEYTIDTDLQSQVRTTGAELDEAIEAASPGSPLVGLGETFLEVQQEYGINAVYQAAHAAHESAWGRSRIARSKNNLFGWGAFDRCPGACADSFVSYAACVRQVMSFIDEKYLSSSGRYYEGATLNGMNVHYATDPRWAEKIASIMRTIGTNLDLEDPRSNPSFTLGDAVITSTDANVRTEPVIDDNVSITYPKNETGVVIDGPVRNDGFVFWQVEYDAANQTGWTVQRDLEAYRNGGGNYRFRIQQRVRTTGQLNVRAGPGESFGNTFTVLNRSNGYIADGPVYDDGTTWWKVAYNAGVTGWSRSSGLVSNPTETDGAFVPNQRLRLRHDTAVHTGAGPDQTVIDVLDGGTVGYVRAGPHGQGGYTWWRLDFNDGTGGWVAEQHLRAQPLPEIEVGSRVNTIREAAAHWTTGVDGDIAKLISRNTHGYVRDGPVEKDNYTWWNVELNTGLQAWFAGKHLAVDESIFDWDQRVTPRVDTTAWAFKSRDGPANGTARTGDVGHIRRGPERANGTLWWIVEFDSGLEGWVSQTNIKPAPAADEPDDSGPEDAIDGVPYFYQYYNNIDPDGTCGNTSVAMLLNYYGWDGTPDELSGQYGDGQSKRPPGAARAFNDIAAAAGLDQRVTASTSASYDDLHTWLEQGKPVVTWGTFTPSGHIVVVLGYTGEEYICHDPAGVWNGRFQGTHYGGGTGGRYVRYDAEDFQRMIALQGLDVVVERSAGHTEPSRID